MTPWREARRAACEPAAVSHEPAEPSGAAPLSGRLQSAGVEQMGRAGHLGGADGAEVPAAARQEAVPLLAAGEDEEGAAELLVEAETAQQRRGQDLVVRVGRDPEDRGDAGEGRGHERSDLVLRARACSGQEEGGGEDHGTEEFHRHHDTGFPMLFGLACLIAIGGIRALLLKVWRPASSSPHPLYCPGGMPGETVHALLQEGPRCAM